MVEQEIKLESAVCDLCGANESKLLYSMPDLRFKSYAREYSVVECKQCGHRFLSPRPTIDSITLVYPEDYYAKRGPAEPRQQKRYYKQLSYLPRIKGRILDVGCAGGGWLKIVQENGWDCYGVDFVESIYKQTGIDIRYGYLSDLGYPESFFNVVSAWGVMEHIHQPSKYFQCIHRLLKKGGKFIFIVPNADSLWSRWAYQEDIPRHLHFFRYETLKMYARKYNYTIQKIESTNDIYSRPASGRGLIKRRLLRKLGVSWREITDSSYKLPVKLIATAASVFDYCLIHPKIEEYFGLCGNMVVIFKKETDEDYQP